jgi:predicted N-formylglutamate amidohydrolase
MTDVTPRDSDEPLLAPDEPPAFEIDNATGRAPLVLVCDHASNRVPRSLDRLGLPEARLFEHIGWDIGAAQVARRLARRFNAPLALTGYSRLVLDCNRALEDPSSIPAESDGVAVPGNRGLTREQRAARAAALFHPYHAAVDELVVAHAKRDEAIAVVSIHSFTQVFGGRRRPWHIGVLWNEDGRIALPLLGALRANPDLVVGDNEPYSGRDAVGYTVRQHAERRGYAHVALEIRQDLIGDAEGAERWANIVGDALQVALPAAGVVTSPREIPA